MAGLAVGPGVLRRQARPFSGPKGAGLKPASTIDVPIVNGGVKMIEIAVILGLFCAGIFVAHAVDALRASDLVPLHESRKAAGECGL